MRNHVLTVSTSGLYINGSFSVTQQAYQTSVLYISGVGRSLGCRCHLCGIRSARPTEIREFRNLFSSQNVTQLPGCNIIASTTFTRCRSRRTMTVATFSRLASRPVFATERFARCVINLQLFALNVPAVRYRGGSIAEWLACWTQAQKGPGSNRSRDAVG